MKKQKDLALTIAEEMLSNYIHTKDDIVRVIFAMLEVVSAFHTCLAEDIPELQAVMAENVIIDFLKSSMRRMRAKTGRTREEDKEAVDVTELIKAIKF